MTTVAMTAGEQAGLIEYATRFGYAIGHKFPRFTEDVVGASLLGAAIAFAAPEFPPDVEGRRKFVGKGCWNMIRRELTFHFRRQPTPFTDLDPTPDIDPVDRHHGPEADWADEFETLAASFIGITAEVFRLTYGPIKLTLAEMGARVRRSIPAVQYHQGKIKARARRRHERMERIG